MTVPAQLRLCQILLPSHVEDLLCAAVRDGDVEYLTGVIGQIQVLTSIPLPTGASSPAVDGG